MGKLNETQIKAMKRMRELGFTVKSVAKSFGVSSQSVLDHTIPGRMERERERKRNFYKRRESNWRVEKC